MAKSKRQIYLAESYRARVRQLRAAGVSVSKIAKETGKSVKHVRQIVKQEPQSNG